MGFTNVNSMVSDMLGVLFLICISDTIEKHSNNVVRLMFERIAYSSMFAYLFHWEFYQIAKRLFHLSDSTIPMYGIVITVFVIFIMSYYGQRMYDIVINKLSRKEKV